MFWWYSDLHSNFGGWVSHTAPTIVTLAKLDKSLRRKCFLIFPLMSSGYSASAPCDLQFPDSNLYLLRTVAAGSARWPRWEHHRKVLVFTASRQP